STILRSTGTFVFGSGAKANLAGRLRREGGTLPVTSGLWNITNGGTYEHAMDGGSLPIMNWPAGTSCEITGIVNTMPTNLTQNFRNVTWNCTGQSASIDNTTNLKTILGNFTIVSTGLGLIYFDQQGNNL